MDLIQHLRIFERVAESRSFSRAAEQLGMAASSVTAAIQRLEGRLGTRLFLRSTRQVLLSHDGEQLRARCRVLLAETEALEQVFRQPTTPAGLLRVELPARMARCLLIPALPGFFARYPGVRLDISGNDRLSDPLAEGIDCVLRVGELSDLNLNARKLGQLLQVTCAAPSLLANFPVVDSLDALGPLPAVHFGRMQVDRPEALEFQTAAGTVSRSLHARIAVANAETYIEAACHGLGVIQVPRYDVADLLRAGTLVEVLPDHPPPSLPLTALYLPQQRASPLVKLFIDWLEALLQRQLALA